LNIRIRKVTSLSMSCLSQKRSNRNDWNFEIGITSFIYLINN
jgi:hypothetical protein